MGKASYAKLSALTSNIARVKSVVDAGWSVLLQLTYRLGKISGHYLQPYAMFQDNIVLSSIMVGSMSATICNTALNTMKGILENIIFAGYSGLIDGIATSYYHQSQQEVLNRNQMGSFLQTIENISNEIKETYKNNVERYNKTIDNLKKIDSELSKNFNSMVSKDEDPLNQKLMSFTSARHLPPKMKMGFIASMSALTSIETLSAKGIYNVAHGLGKTVHQLYELLYHKNVQRSM